MTPKVKDPTRATTMQASLRATLECANSFSFTDFRPDLPAFKVPTLVLHGDDDQVVPIANSADKAIKLLKNGTQKTYAGLSHGFFATHPDLVNADLLAFVES